MRSTAFGSKHFRPGGRSWHPASAESSVLFCRFCAVAAVAKGLPVFFVPKQPRVPLVGRDVVHLGRQGTASPAPALHAPRMIRQIRLAHPPPRSAIPTAGGAGPPVRRLRRVPLAVASGGYQGGAPRVPARVLGFGWHFYPPLHIHDRFHRLNDLDQCLHSLVCCGCCPVVLCDQWVGPRDPIFRYHAA